MNISKTFNLFELVFFFLFEILRSTFFVHFYDSVINSSKIRTTIHEASFETICKENSSQFTNIWYEPKNSVSSLTLVSSPPKYISLILT